MNSPAKPVPLKCVDCGNLTRWRDYTPTGVKVRCATCVSKRKQPNLIVRVWRKLTNS
jgi:hypothetical protein